MTVMADLRARAHLDATLERFPIYTPPAGPDAGWWHQAACRGVTAERFFGKAHTASHTAQMCNTCPARHNCLLDALHTEVDQGNDVFGRRWIAAKHRIAFLRTYRAGNRPDPPVDGHDDVALMLVLCDRIAHNLNQPDHTEPST